jgi:hypothetical protein
MLRPLVIVAVVALQGCASVPPLASAEHAKIVALAYITSHHAPLPNDYTVTADSRDYAAQSGQVYPVYGVDIWGRDRATRGATYTVVVNRRTFEIHSFVNNSGIPMPWMYDEYVKNRKIR